LEVNQVPDPRPYEYMMAAPNSFDKPQMSKKAPQIVEVDV
jgi:hypothetical protein